MDQYQQQEEFTGEARYLNRCAFHPDVETGLACGRCGNYICTRCIIQTSVGSRCKNCARVTTLPTFEVRPSYYMRAVLAGGLSALTSGVVFLLIFETWGDIPFVTSLLIIGTGYLVGEAISTAVNRKRGPGLAVVAAGSMVVFSLTSGLIFYLSSSDIFSVLILGLACYSAIIRVR